MFIKKFENNDLLYNKVIVYPKTKIFIKDQKAYFKNYSPTGQNIEDSEANNLPPYTTAVYGTFFRDYGCLAGFNFICPENSQYVPLI